MTSHIRATSSETPATIKIALAAFGLENRSVYKYLIRNGMDKSQITIADNEELEDTPEGVATIFGKDAFTQLSDFDVVFRSPPIRHEDIKTDGLIWSSTNEFFKKCPSRIIAVTGTKGKGTTSTLIANILNEAGIKAHLLGNIGSPALDSIEEIGKDDIAVYEMSSFQSWDLGGYNNSPTHKTPWAAPDTAVVLMIEPDHLDIHKDMQEYLGAKANLLKNQTKDNLLVHHPSNPLTLEVVKGCMADKKAYQTLQGAHVDSGEVIIDGQKICSIGDIGLVGEHNLENVCAAVTAAWAYTQDTDAIAKACVEFKGLPHRLELAGVVDRVEYYDDSFATGVASSVAAVKSFPSKNKILIFGGYDKKIDVTDVLNELNDKDTLILIGQSADNLEAEAAKRNLNFVNLGSDLKMSEIVKKCADLANNNSVVLLSPGHASFGMFESYKVRGDLFKFAVKDLT